MPVISYEPQILSELVKREQWEDLGYCRKTIVIDEADTTSVPFGAALGKVTASGKYKVAVETASDGSKDPVAVFLGANYDGIGQALIATASDDSALVLIRGDAVVGGQTLVLDASFDNAAKVEAAYESLAAKGIVVFDQV